MKLVIKELQSGQVKLELTMSVAEAQEIRQDLTTQIAIPSDLVQRIINGLWVTNI